MSTWPARGVPGDHRRALGHPGILAEVSNSDFPRRPRTAVRRGYETCGAYQTRRRRSGRYVLIFLTGRRLGRLVDGWVASAALMSAAMAGSRRSLSRQRLRFGPMGPKGVPRLAL